MKVSKSIRNTKVEFSMLRQGELMVTLGALGKFALDRGWTAGASKGSAIRYVKSETTLWAAQYTLRLRTHFRSLSVNQHLVKSKNFSRSTKIIDVKRL